MNTIKKESEIYTIHNQNGCGSITFNYKDLTFKDVDFQFTKQNMMSEVLVSYTKQDVCNLIDILSEIKNRIEEIEKL